MVLMSHDSHLPDQANCFPLPANFISPFGSFGSCIPHPSSLIPGDSGCTRTANISDAPSSRSSVVPEYGYSFAKQKRESFFFCCPSQSATSLIGAQRCSQTIGHSAFGVQLAASLIGQLLPCSLSLSLPCARSLRPPALRLVYAYAYAYAQRPYRIPLRIIHYQRSDNSTLAHSASPEPCYLTYPSLFMFQQSPCPCLVLLPRSLLNIILSY